MSAPWPKVRVDEVLRRSDEVIELDPGVTYRQVTVRLWGGGVIERGKVLGSEIASDRQFLVRPDQFIISRIDARNGASGLVPEVLDGAVVTNDFPVFRVNRDRLIPAYLKWLSRTEGFVSLCRAASEGTTNRVRLKEDRFLAMALPLPPLPEQWRIVARIEELAGQVALARTLHTQAYHERDALTSSITTALFNPTHLAAYSSFTLGEVADIQSGVTLVLLR